MQNDAHVHIQSSWSLITPYTANIVTCMRHASSTQSRDFGIWTRKLYIFSEMLGLVLNFWLFLWLYEYGLCFLGTKLCNYRNIETILYFMFTKTWYVAQSSRHKKLLYAFHFIKFRHIWPVLPRFVPNPQARKPSKSPIKISY